MAHYSLLRDYRFSNALDDIRGAKLYDFSGEQVGTMNDIVFDHMAGDTRYVVVDIGQHMVLVPSEKVYRSFKADGFETDLNKAEAQALPAFDETMLESEEHSTEHEKAHLDAWHKRAEQTEKEYEMSYSDDPVEHRKGSDRFITPGPSDMPPEPANTERKRVISSADVTPQRIRDKFSGPSHPMFLATTGEASSRTTMSISHTANTGYHDLSPRWIAFQDNVKRHIDHIRRRLPSMLGAQSSLGQGFGYEHDNPIVHELSNKVYSFVYRKAI